MGIEEAKITRFLLDRGAGTVPHPGGTLYEHVVRVAGLLADWAAGDDLEAAGLCHACYETDGFGPALLDLADRSVLRGLIGERAEALVYLYGSCDRDAVYPLLGRSGPVRFRDRFTGRTRSVAEGETRAFVELTAANELDVLRHRADTARQGPNLLWLFAGARSQLSDEAWDAWSRLPPHDPPALRPGPAMNAGSEHPVAVTDLDHLVLTVTDLDRTVDFYERVLGMRPVTFGNGRRALKFGRRKLNLHAAGHEFEPRAARPAPGSADLCFLTTVPPGAVISHLEIQHVAVESGPVTRAGAHGAIRSVYVRDPDGNLIEIASYPAESSQES